MKTGSDRSNQSEITTGVPQGSVLGSLACFLPGLGISLQFCWRFYITYKI